MVKKRNLKEHLTDDDTLDLSLSELQSVPVKEIAAIPKATGLDLSSNQLTSLGLNFASSLVHLVKLDLCRNQLTELPENFGLLINLKHLDLYRNNLQTLPLSFCKLKHLRWLDLKENPLVPKMMQVVGPCLDKQGCQFAARNVVRFLGDLNREVEAEKLRKEIQQKEQHEKELLEQTRKKEPKKKKKKKNAAKLVENNREEIPENGSAITENTDNNFDKLNGEGNNIDKEHSGKTVFSSIMSLIRTCVINLIILGIGYYIISSYDKKTYRNAMKVIEKNMRWFTSMIPKWMWIYLQQVRTFLAAVFVNLVSLAQYSVSKIMETYVIVMSNEDVQLYINTAKEYMNILFIQIADTCTRFIRFLASYFE